MMNHELITLRPVNPETKRDVAWQALMVEFGVDFAFDDQYQLPDTLPDDMTGVKAISIAEDSIATYREGTLKEKIDRFLASGGIIVKCRGPEDQSPIDENATRGNLEMLLASGDLTMNHPRLRERLQARTFRELYDALREPYLEGQIEGGLAKGMDAAFNEPYAYNILHLMELLDEYDPEAGWHDRLRNVLDRMMAMTDVDMVNLDRTTGLTVFIRMSERTGDPQYRTFATDIVRRVVDSFSRIEGVPVLQPNRDRILWNESLAHLPPACTAVGDEDLIDLSVNAARVLHRLNYDPQRNLWRHWGAPGREGPAVWARGQGWALTGLTGILRHLPKEHEAHGELCAYIDEIVDGLATTQNEEGLWHNVVDLPDQSRVATRASAMFVYCLAEARRAGWVKAERVDTMLHKAWRGVRGRIWRDKLCSVCCGTGACATLQSYLSRPMLFYGASSALRAGVTMVLTYGEDGCVN